MSGVNETRILLQLELCECKCRFNGSVFNSKHKWNHDECLCECNELNDLDFCKDDYMCNPSTCSCECQKTCKNNF